MVIWVVLLTLSSTLLALTLASLSSAVVSGRRRRRRAVGLFHPCTNDGGGGERVLWCAVRAFHEVNPDLDCAVYTGDDASPRSLAARALDRFGVKLLRPPLGVVQLLEGAVAGLHALIDEHFGISVVEYMAAGAVPIAHNSAWPKMDIVLEDDGHQTGFLASDKEEYAYAILKILKMPD